MKKEKICTRLNTMQVGDEIEIRTYCTDCNEMIKLEIIKVRKK